MGCPLRTAEGNGGALSGGSSPPSQGARRFRRHRDVGGLLCGRMDVWSSGDSYEAYMGRWSRAAAGPFLSWLDLPAGARWLDVGCGTGALTGEILGGAAPS